MSGQGVENNAELRNLAFSDERPNPIDVHVGGRVRLRRLIVGMSQEKLAEELGLTFQQVQKYEKGANRMGASRLFQIALILSVKACYFYEDLPVASSSSSGPGFAERNPDDLVQDFLNTREGLELNRAFARIRSPAMRRSFIDLIKAAGDEAGAKKDADAAL